jgi:hypothetical protein
MRHVHGKESRRRNLRDIWICRVLVCRTWLTAVTLVWGLLGIPGAHAQSPKPTDYDVKAVYLYNFGRFVEWPGKVEATPGSSFTVCVLGQDPFGPSLDTILAGETIGGKAVVAKRISSAQESGNCQILFLSFTEASRLNKIITDLGKKAVLTVSDMPQFVKSGGMIQFVSEGHRIRFEVNLAATQRAGLTLSSELLKVATVVRKNFQPGD